MTAAHADVAPAGPLKLAFAYQDILAGDVFSPEHLDRLGGTFFILAPVPLESVEAKKALAVLAQVEVLLTGWGCPRIDRHILACAPHLRMIAHAAGSVKSLLAPEVFDSGITVSNAADANAIPVAEFTLAAIPFASKNIFGFQRLYSRQRDGITPSQLTGIDCGNWQRTVGIVGFSRIGSGLSSY